jgi:uncharacterized protein YyaL (SSP411 family)
MDPVRLHTVTKRSALIQLTEQEVTTMSVNWIKDADEALNQAKSQNKPLLIDFSAAPA